MNCRSIARWCILLFLLLVGAVYVYRNAEEFRILSTIKLSVLPFLFIPPLLTFLILGLLNKALVKEFGVDLTFREWYGLSVVTALGNLLLPMRMGASMRAAYLKTFKGFPIRSFLSTMAATYLINSLLAALIGAGCIALLGDMGNPTHRTLLFLLFGLAIMLSSFFWIRNLSLESSHQWLQYVGEIIKGWIRIKSRPHLMGALSVLLLTNYLIIALNLNLCFYALSIECRFSAALAIASLLGFSRLISITPANLGVQEGITAFLAHALGIGFNEGLMASVLVRIPMTLTIFAIGPLFAYLLSIEDFRVFGRREQ